MSDMKNGEARADIKVIKALQEDTRKDFDSFRVSLKQDFVQHKQEMHVLLSTFMKQLPCKEYDILKSDVRWMKRLFFSMNLVLVLCFLGALLHIVFN